MQRSQLSRIAANQAAHRLMEISDQHPNRLNVHNAERCLPPGWVLADVSAQDLYPVTITNFVRIYRAHAVHVPTPLSTIGQKRHVH